MVYVCVELVGFNCKFCFEEEECVDIQLLLRKTKAYCNTPLDPETTAILVNDRMTKEAETICTSTNVKIIRLVKGGI